MPLVGDQVRNGLRLKCVTHSRPFRPLMPYAWSQLASSISCKHESQIHMAIGDIIGFVSLSDDLATAGQPSEKQIRELAEMGFEVIINLGLLDPRYCLEDEAAVVHSLGLEYRHIPVNFQAPKGEDLARFFEAMQSVRGKRVFVHCAVNYRVSSLISLYGQARLGWSLQQAEEHIKRLWEPNEVWARFIEVSRRELGVSG
jgi:protein tyrosine phosphatase (PTP) superfamily phosphohydrolase (DUF442 family)